MATELDKPLAEFEWYHLTSVATGCLVDSSMVNPRMVKKIEEQDRSDQGTGDHGKMEVACC
ncbi:hypothetical protein VP01_289g8 [Puccinia sorghi]|uniref:Uncharacterized protein n=1 Tax=Puccinia sorghi TaxID=27349 RepID=A0A0L6V1I4_9BASI|nr:hypothetical protein VP01_289g8 [Puccinia sorghi]